LQNGKWLQRKENPMRNDTAFCESSASGGVQRQIESFLQTVMEGLMDRQEEEKAGRKVEFAKRKFVDGSAGGRSTGHEISADHLAVVGRWWLVGVALL
jgi:hypothetical protein